MRVVTANVNGIRAAARRGGLDWLAESGADVITLQEVRAGAQVLRETLEASGLRGWHVADDAGALAGRAGVAVLSLRPIHSWRTEIGEAFHGQGRWLEAEVEVEGSGGGRLTVVSTYVHTGQAGTPRQDEKHAFLEAVTSRMAAWTAAGARVVLTGDLNVAHTDSDLKNWKGNRGKAGCLDSERGYLTAWRDVHGWRDVHRDLHGPGPGPHTWWSWRGKAFDTDAGWRIDYQWASPSLAPHARMVSVGRAPSYAQRWSDHAPVVVDYDLAAPLEATAANG